ncbi:MAG: Transcriptional activator spt7 [Cirrosporium novae-zelandiae]|nr:MAG: Transcriptional activator spt7 [Cirrosporium novae-zelandiae]
MSLGHQAHLATPPDKPIDARLTNGNIKKRPRSRTPNAMADSGNATSLLNPGGDGGDGGSEEDTRAALFNKLFAQSEGKIGALFGGLMDDTTGSEIGNNTPPIDQIVTAPADDDAPRPSKRRKIDEDDYDDFDDDDEDASPANASPPKTKSTGLPIIRTSSSPTKQPPVISRSPSSGRTPSQQPPGKSLEDVRKKLEQDKKATEEAARRMYNTMFSTLEHDSDAMLEQRKLDESERQVEAEMSGSSGGQAGNAPGNTQHGTLSTANLGASSLTLKHLLARIDAKRDQVHASDTELRNLISEVRKNRSKWANEDKIGQEELYEAAEKVLSELKAMTEHSSAFLTRVNKREAPDYYNIIKQPMDLGSMTKKLKAIQYKSKQEFVNDLNLIWDNCLKYNANPEHFLRKHARYMQKETDKLIPLIPDIVIRDRAEVEAEERRLHAAEGDLEGAEESDDEPIMSSRGRQAHGKGAHKGVASSRKGPTVQKNGSEDRDQKPVMQPLNSSTSGLLTKLDFLRADSEADGSQNGFATPPPGTLTPLNGLGTGAACSQADMIDMDGIQSLAARSDDTETDDPIFKVWKQITKKDRASLASERNRLFKGDKLNPDEPALLRTKSGMRRWMRKQREVAGESTTGTATTSNSNDTETGATGETLAEGIDGDERDLPDYYDCLSAIPDLPERTRWIEDAEGQVIDASDEFLRVVPSGYFTAPQSKLTAKMEQNMRQMQETRKLCTKIGVVKQMQLQQQMYQNQFQKYDPEPFKEMDITPHVVTEEGAVMSSLVCKATLQRSVAKIFYHAGFEEFQPAAFDAITDIAADYFANLVRSLCVYREAPKTKEVGVDGKTVHPYTAEEMILHCLHENGQDVESLESYVKEDVDRLGQKLGVMHERMKSHLAELLRPALADGGPDGSYAFNDGSDQFKQGDFADEIDEDFFGFKELGLDKELGLASLSVPFHLLQNRMYTAHQAQNATTTSAISALFPPPPAYPPISIDNVDSQIGLMQNFYREKLHKNNERPLMEEDDLPQKQRLPKPRLPPTGKITSPRKRPMKSEAGGGAKKKQKTGTMNKPDGDEEKKPILTKPVGKLKLPIPGSVSGHGPGEGTETGAAPMERLDSSNGKANGSEMDKEDGMGMMSPESLPIQDLETH